MKRLFSVASLVWGGLGVAFGYAEAKGTVLSEKSGPRIAREIATGGVPLEMHVEYQKSDDSFTPGESIYWLADSGDPDDAIATLILRDDAQGHLMFADIYYTNGSNKGEKNAASILAGLTLTLGMTPDEIAILDDLKVRPEDSNIYFSTSWCMAARKRIALKKEYIYDNQTVWYMVAATDR